MGKHAPAIIVKISIGITVNCLVGGEEIEETPQQGERPSKTPQAKTLRFPT